MSNKFRILFIASLQLAVILAQLTSNQTHE